MPKPPSQEKVEMPKDKRQKRDLHALVRGRSPVRVHLPRGGSAPRRDRELERSRPKNGGSPAQGADLERVRLSLYRALGEDAPPAAQVSRAPATVTPIAKARPDRVLTVLRSISVAVVASFFGLFVWREGMMRVAPDRPA